MQMLVRRGPTHHCPLGLNRLQQQCSDQQRRRSEGSKTSAFALPSRYCSCSHCYNENVRFDFKRSQVDPMTRVLENHLYVYML